jgi:chromosome partitioning protein
METVGIYTEKGGTGKTTTATTTASLLASRGYRVLVLDLDQQCHASSLFLGTRGEQHKSILQVMHGEIGIRDAVRSCPTYGELSVIPGHGALLKSLRESTERRTLARAIAPLDADFDWVVIDSAPGDSIVLENALCASDYYVAPTLAFDDDIHGVLNVTATANRLQISGDCHAEFLGALVTRYDSRSRFVSDRVTQLTQRLPTFEAHIPVDVRCPEARASNLTVDRYRPRARATRAYEAFLEEMLDDISFLKNGAESQQDAELDFDASDVAPNFEPLSEPLSDAEPESKQEGVA